MYMCRGLTMERQTSKQFPVAASSPQRNTCGQPPSSAALSTLSRSLWHCQNLFLCSTVCLFTGLRVSGGKGHVICLSVPRTQIGADIQNMLQSIQLCLYVQPMQKTKTNKQNQHQPAPSTLCSETRMLDLDFESKGITRINVDRHQVSIMDLSQKGTFVSRGAGSSLALCLLTE